MALLTTRSVEEMLLKLEDENAEFNVNHIFEPEYHQDKYVTACTSTANSSGAFQLGKAKSLVYGPVRGTQPSYADSEDDSSSLFWQGMVMDDGSILEDEVTSNICALKSNCIRRGFIDYSLARSVNREFYAKKTKAVILKNDVLVNSTGDGTIGRVAVFNGDFPAIVDGHISIIRFANPIDAWYVAAFLLSEAGQRQMYRYINGSSGQVEIYPQDLSRIWVKEAESPQKKIEIANALMEAASLHLSFYTKLQSALSSI